MENIAFGGCIETKKVNRQNGAVIILAPNATAYALAGAIAKARETAAYARDKRIHIIGVPANAYANGAESAIVLKELEPER